MPRSFKFKIALLSMLLSGIMLITFSLIFLRMTYNVGIERTDRELRALVDSELRKTQPRNHWIRFEEALRDLYGESNGKHFLLNVFDRQGELLHLSDDWIQEIGSAAISQPPPISVDAENLTNPERPRPYNLRQRDRPPAPRPLEISDPAYTTIGGWRVMTIHNPEVNLSLGISLESFNAEIARYRNGILLTIPIAMLLMIGGGYILAQIALRPVNIIARTARKVSALHLDERIPQTDADHEFLQLIEVINDMLNRLESSFQQAARFSADAAHELKTPLTILHGELQAALQTSVDGTDDQRTYKAALDEVQRLKSIIRKLLLLSQADSGNLTIHRETIDLSNMIQDACYDMNVLDPSITIKSSIQPGITVMGDKDLLTQVIQNLAGNAVKFSQGISPIEVSLTESAEAVHFRITNRGACIPEADRQRVFERFYRTDKARSREIGGTGLGLSLAREIALSHNGTLELLESNPDRTTFQLILPSGKASHE